VAAGWAAEWICFSKRMKTWV